MPNFYFLGLPIKELVKEYFSNGECHSCAIALSLCFDECELITCNLANYAEYLGCEDYEHSIILVKLNGEAKVIGTTFCLITDLETYKDIFAPDSVRVIKKEELKRADAYKFIDSLKDSYIAPPDERLWLENKEPSLIEQEHQKLLRHFDDLCLNYYNENSQYLTDFIRRCLSRNFCYAVHNSLRISLKYNKFEYPKANLISLEDSDLLFNDTTINR